MNLELDQPPNLLGLYARAAVTGPLHRGDELPAAAIVLRVQAIDVDHLAAYQRVCGFRVQDMLPPTYLHVLAFPVTVSLMTQREFPLPLVGLVHVGNVIEQRRPVGIDETVTLTVRAADLREHRTGRQVDVLADATVGDEIVWRSRSTYLRRAKPSGRNGPRPPHLVSEAPSGPTIVIRVPGDIGRRYAAVSGDRNPIHLYPLTARAFGFPRAIAHGMWLKARLLATLEARLPEAFSAEVTFRAPVLLPSAVTFVATTQDGTWHLDARNARSAKLHLAGTIAPLS